MKHFHIGLDFGTSQTKVCVQNIDTRQHFFHEFDSTQSYFLPSTLIIEDKITYGIKAEDNNNFYDFFKIASAEDEDFLIETFGHTDEQIQKYVYLKQLINPALLSTIYITYVLLDVKKKIKDKYKQQNNLKGILAKTLTNKIDDQECTFSVCIGIPTEWSQEKNLIRKQRFESILLISELLQEKVKDLKTYLDLTFDEIKDIVLNIYDNLKDLNKIEILQILNDRKLMVYPETAAGLSTIINTGQIRSGYYATVDIGGGSSDISFFYVSPNKKIKYIASESYLVAIYSILKDYKEKKKSNKSLSELQNELFNNNNQFEKSIIKIQEDLSRCIYKLFNKRVRLFDREMTRKYDLQNIICYGGGAKINKFVKKEVLIHDNGVKIRDRVKWTFMSKESISNFNFEINLEIENNNWKDKIELLIVSLGLSYIQSPESAIWFDDSSYNALDFNTEKIAHPINADCYLYDITTPKIIAPKKSIVHQVINFDPINQSLDVLSENEIESLKYKYEKEIRELLSRRASNDPEILQKKEFIKRIEYYHKFKLDNYVIEKEKREKLYNNSRKKSSKNTTSVSQSTDNKNKIKEKKKTFMQFIKENYDHTYIVTNEQVIHIRRVTNISFAKGTYSNFKGVYWQKKNGEKTALFSINEKKEIFECDSESKAYIAHNTIKFKENKIVPKKNKITSSNETVNTKKESKNNNQKSLGNILSDEILKKLKEIN